MIARDTFDRGRYHESPGLASALQADIFKWASTMTVGKRVQFDDQMWAVVNLLRQERRRSFQQLADEAFADLLAKYGHQVDVENQFRASLGKEPMRRPRRRTKAKSAGN